MTKKNIKNKNFLRINLDDGNKIVISFKKAEIKIFLADSKKVISSFDSSDIKGLSFFDEHDNPLNYLREQISNDSSIDEVLDIYESIKDNTKQLYRENPDLIDYSKNFQLLDENLSQVQNKIVEDKVNLKSKNNGFPEILIGVLILLSFIFFADSLESFADMRWEDGWVNILKLPFTFLFGIAPIIILLWPISGIALIIDGYKRNQKKS